MSRFRFEPSRTRAALRRVPAPRFRRSHTMWGSRTGLLALALASFISITMVGQAAAGWAVGRLPARSAASTPDSTDSFCRRQLSRVLDGFVPSATATGRSRDPRVLSSRSIMPPPGVDVSVESEWSAVSVPVRSLHSAVYDPAGDRMLVFGGGTNGRTTHDLLSLSLSAPDATWQPVGTLGSGPSSRCSHASALDPTRRLMLVFGGMAGMYQGPLSDAWLLDVGSGTWQLVTPAGPSPTGGPAAAIYDPAGNRFVVWAGNQVWALSLAGGPAWTLVQSNAPLVSPTDPPPVAVQALRDGARGRMLVLASGYDGGSALKLSDGSWTNPWPVSPYSSRPFGAVIDSVGDRLLCFGGPSNIDRTVWERPLGGAGGSWSPVSSIAGTPPLGRCDQASVYDPVRRRMVFFGGADYDVYPYNDTWALELGATPSWHALSVVPEARQSPMAAYDVGGDRLVLFSGFPTGPQDNDTWLMDLESGRWRALDPAALAPPARSGGTLAYDPPNHRLLLFGGAGATDYDDVWALSLDGEPTWTLIDVPGLKPPGRFGHAAILDPSGHRMLVIGGFSNTAGALHDVWALSLDGTPSWELLPTTGETPLYLTQLSVGLDTPQNRLIVMERDAVESVYTLPLAAPMTWTRMDLSHPPAFQQGRPAIYDARLDRFVMFGASDAGTAYDATFQLGLVGPLAWNELPTTAFRPRTRWGDAAVHDTHRNRLLVYGGFDGDRYYSDTWALPFTDAVTSATLALLSSELAPDEASLVWQGSPLNGENIVLERAKPDRTWRPLATLAADAGGFVRYADRDVVAGARYGYRLRIGSGASERLTAETWVEIPNAATLALAPSAGNPLRGQLDFGVTLTDATPARIEMLDTAGRRVATRTLTGLSPGHHTIRLEPPVPPGPGLYLVRLTQGPRAATFKAAIVR